MPCPFCQYETRESDSFCVKCGAYVGPLAYPMFASAELRKLCQRWQASGKAIETVAITGNIDSKEILKQLESDLMGVSLAAFGMGEQADSELAQFWQNWAGGVAGSLLD